MNPKLTAIPFALALAGAGPAFALDELQVYGIANFNGSGQCSSGKSHQRHVTTAALFSAPFQILIGAGLWDGAATVNNSSARGSYFTDAGKAGACGCSADDLNVDRGIDDPDVIWVHTHGSHTASGGSYYSNISMGTNAYVCEPRTDQNLRVGQNGGDLDIAVIKACQSADYDVFVNGGYRAQITTSTSGFSMWNGFHGDSSCSSSTEIAALTYAWSSFSDGAGENWIDLFYADAPTIDDDDCPASIVMGATAIDRNNMYAFGGWLDRKNTGSKTGSVMFSIAGCDPSRGRVLPSS